MRGCELLDRSDCKHPASRVRLAPASGRASSGMSQQLIQQYLNQLSDLRKASGTGREGVVSEAFKDLLKGHANVHDLIFIPQYELPKQDGNRRIIDGALVYQLRVPFGYWEAKDEEDDLDKEIAAKLRRGYGVLYDPVYREKYTQNLRREFPRIPFYADFWKWTEWGEKLMASHIGYEDVKPWKLKRVDVPDDKSKKARLAPKVVLKADKENGIIVVDSETQLTGVPDEAWNYRLGNRSALE
jgi:Type ISP C-terminal specificity domain